MTDAKELTLEEMIQRYTAKPTGGGRSPVPWQLSTDLQLVLGKLAATRGVPLDGYVEWLLFKAVRAENARLLVGEKPDLIPSSFLDERVAQARRDLEEQVAANKAHEERGDKATRIAAQMQAVLDDTTGELPDSHVEDLQRRNATAEAQLDMALQKEKKRNE